MYILGSIRNFVNKDWASPACQFNAIITGEEGKIVTR